MLIIAPLGGSVLRIQKCLGLLLVAVAVFACQPLKHQKSQIECIETRGAFDIGSGSTKLKVFRFDKCENRILAEVFDKSEKVDYEDAYAGSSNESLPQNIQDKGSAAIRRLIKAAASETPARYRAVMTGTFRKAKNAENYRKRLENQFDFPFVILSEEQEAELGYLAAAHSRDLSSKDILVWDIGGSTMQFATKTNGKFHYVSHPFASVGFKNALLEEFEKSASTPNPISESEAKRAAQIARTEAKKLRTRMNWKRFKKPTVVGIGSVHFYSLGGQLRTKESYTKASLQAGIARQIGKSDDEIGGDYASTDVSNLLLVKGFMDELELKSIRLARVDLREGMLFYTDWWGDQTGP